MLRRVATISGVFAFWFAIAWTPRVDASQCEFIADLALVSLTPDSPQEFGRWSNTGLIWTVDGSPNPPFQVSVLADGGSFRISPANP